MSLPEQLTKLVHATIGPSPWFWETFPEVRGRGHRRYRWRFHGQEEGLQYVVTLHCDGEPERPRLALNTLCRPFVLRNGRLGIWCPQGRELRLACFQVDRLRAFALEEIVGWFAPSGERLYAATAPQDELYVSLETAGGVHPLEVPECLRGSDEVLAPVSYPGADPNGPAFAIFVFYLQAGLLEVLPQGWITRVNYDVANHWITRAVRDPRTHRIVGQLSRAGVFELGDNGTDFNRWL